MDILDYFFSKLKKRHQMSFFRWTFFSIPYSKL